MSDPIQPPPALREQLEALERENRLLREAMQQAERLRQLSDQAVQKLQLARADLAKLYRVSQALRETIELENIYPQVLDLLAEAFHLAPDAERGIFLVDGCDMKLVAHSASNPGFLEAHEGMQVGTCLCGQAAAQGEIINIASCAQDLLHTLPWASGRPHGHLIIPLKARKRVIGVLFCYLPENTQVDERQLKLFHAIGDQIGTAIDNARLYEEKRQASLHDALTGLDNRRSMGLALDRLLAEARRYGTPLAVAMVDIDFFKQFNDNHGHPAGDALLVQVAQIVRSGLRETDLAVRYGGEEFLLIFPHTTAQQATVLAERMREMVAADTSVTISVGVAGLGPQCDSPASLVAAADAAMYQAKQAGRNRIVTRP